MFYQGDLELNPASTMTVQGDIACNGNIYMGVSATATPSITLKLTGNKISYKGYFNSDADGNIVYNKYQGAATTPITYKPPVDTLINNITTGSSVLSQLNEEESFLGGLDASEIISLNHALFPDTATAAENENNVYRSLLLPPPNIASSEEYPSSTVADDDTLATKRLYNKAADGGVIITITGTSATITTGSSTATAPLSVVTGTSTIYDGRVRNSSNVATAVTLTTIDIGQLATWINGHCANFNGILYINMDSNRSTNLAAARLINAMTTPIGTDTNSHSGFTVVTNSGIYIQGDYNTGTSYTQGDYSTISSTPSLLMADSVTLLSAGWLDSSSDTSAKAVDASARLASATTTINSSILTGNTPTIPNGQLGAGKSGGAQNLVSYLENWTGYQVYVHGSVGCLFYSKYFKGFNDSSSYYRVPNNRYIDFNSTLKNSPPPSGPTITTFSRGSLFNW